MLGLRGLFWCTLFLSAINLEEHMLEKHESLECGNIYKILNFSIPLPKYTYISLFKGSSRGQKLFPTNFFNPFPYPYQSSTRIMFLCIRSCVHMLMKHTKKCYPVANLEVSTQLPIINYLENTINIIRYQFSYQQFSIVTAVFVMHIILTDILVSPVNRNTHPKINWPHSYKYITRCQWSWTIHVYFYSTRYSCRSLYLQIFILITSSNMACDWKKIVAYCRT